MADHVYIDMNEQSYNYDDVQAPSITRRQHNAEGDVTEHVEPQPSIYRHPPSDNRKVHGNTCGYQELQQQGGKKNH